MPYDRDHKPPMVIICECHAKFFIFPSKREIFDIEFLNKAIRRKILIGSSTVKSIADVGPSDKKEVNEELDVVFQNNSIRDPIHLIETDTDDDDNDDDCHEIAKHKAIKQSNEKVLFKIKIFLI